jgi:predicted tellurium resistance membrane protein TerC
MLNSINTSILFTSFLADNFYNALFQNLSVVKYKENPIFKSYQRQDITFKKNTGFKFKMGMIETLLLLAIGFVAFFATGIDDTVAYAGSYLEEGRKKHAKFISLGIIIGTLIALGISIFAGALMEKYLVINGKPIGHLIGGTVLVSLGLIMFFKGKFSMHHKKKHYKKLHTKIKKKPKKKGHNFKFIGLGMALFFATAIDDIIAYSNLIMAKGSWIGISIGVLLATFVSLIIAHFLSDKLKKLPHPEKIGAGIVIIIGILLAVKIL